MADVAQLVRAPVCGTGCRRFESDHPPHIKNFSAKQRSFLFMGKTSEISVFIEI